MVKALRVCYFGTYRSEYSRNQIMIEGLRRAGAEVVICHEPLWHSIEDRVQIASGGWVQPGFWWRLLRTYARLIRRFTKIGEFDILVIGYPGQFDVFPARLISWLKHKPLVWDIFMSIYLISIERGLDIKNPWTVDSLRRIEKVACRLPDLLIIDTIDYAVWFGEIHNVPSNKFRLVPTGADETIYYPINEIETTEKIFKVLYFGTFIPNHGVRYIVEAAHILKDQPDIQFRLIGDGPDKHEALNMAKEFELNNLLFVDWLETHDLVHQVADADICLGAFGNTPQSLMTVQNKIYAGMAMKKTVITGDSPAIRRVFTHGEDIYLCERANPNSLAEAIRHLFNNTSLRARISTRGNAVYLSKYTTIKIGEQFLSHLTEIQGVS